MDSTFVQLGVGGIFAVQVLNIVVPPLISVIKRRNGNGTVEGPSVRVLTDRLDRLGSSVEGINGSVRDIHACVKILLDRGERQ